MLAAVYIYDGFVQFEVVLSSYFLRAKGEVVVVSSDGEPHRSAEGFLTMPDVRLADLDLDTVDALILPGGWEKDIIDQEGLHAALRSLDASGKIIAAICGGPLQLARAGLLKGRRYTSSVADEHSAAFAGADFIDENVVVDGNIVTAQPHGFVDMALQLGRMLDIFEDERDYLETVQAFREQRRPTV